MKIIAKRKIHEPNPPTIPTPMARMLSLTNEGTFVRLFSKKVLIWLKIELDGCDSSERTLFV